MQTMQEETDFSDFLDSLHSQAQQTELMRRDSRQKVVLDHHRKSECLRDIRPTTFEIMRLITFKKSHLSRNTLEREYSIRCFALYASHFL